MTQIFCSQCIAVLCSEAPGLAELRLILEREGYTIKADEDISEWPEMQGAGLTLATSFENGASCLVDICDFPWPDDLGVTGDPTLLTGAHALGAFGPFAHPGAFERALQAPEYQSIAPDARNHRAFVRFRVSLLIPSDAGSEAIFASTENANPAWEIAYLLRVAVSLRKMPVALAYFNSTSEQLLSMQGLADIITFAHKHKTYPVEAVCRLRGYKIDEEYSLVDSIGLEQLGMRDHEFSWNGDKITRQEQIEFLINLLHYQIDKVVQMADGHTTDGPHNNLWRAEERENSYLIPPRKVLHWTIGTATDETVFPRQNQGDLAAENDHDSKSDQQPVVNKAIQAAIQIAESLLAEASAIRNRASAWVLSKSFHETFYNDAPPPSIR